MEWTVRVPGYEGPLEVLLELLANNQMDISQVTVAQITDEYLAYLEALPQEDLELYTEFLVIAARLLALKARLLLPSEISPPSTERDEPAAEEASDLVERLSRYQRFRSAAAELEERECRRLAYWDRGVDPEVYRWAVEGINPLAGVSLATFAEVAREILVKPVREASPENWTPGERVNLEELRRLIRNLLDLRRRVVLQQLFFTPRRLIWGLLLVLIMAQQGEVGLEQPELWGDIFVYARGG
jgi:segregation and condensation protein A